MKLLEVIYSIKITQNYFLLQSSAGDIMPGSGFPSFTLSSAEVQLSIFKSKTFSKNLRQPLSSVKLESFKQIRNYCKSINLKKKERFKNCNEIQFSACFVTCFCTLAKAYCTLLAVHICKCNFF